MNDCQKMVNRIFICMVIIVIAIIVFIKNYTLSN